MGFTRQCLIFFKPSANPRPDALMKEQLTEMTGLSARVVRVWFQNKRCKEKKKLREATKVSWKRGNLQGRLINWVLQNVSTLLVNWVSAAAVILVDKSQINLWVFLSADPWLKARLFTKVENLYKNQFLLSEMSIKVCVALVDLKSKFSTFIYILDS